MVVNAAVSSTGQRIRPSNAAKKLPMPILESANGSVLKRIAPIQGDILFMLLGPYILSGTLMPNRPMDCLMTFPMNTE